MRAIAMLILLATLGAGTPPTGPITLFLVGDSTMADKPAPETNPERGWGQMLTPLFDEGVRVRNFAAGGRSTKSFLTEGRWEAVRRMLRPGDFVFIQFGHNDQKDQDPARYTNPYTGYRRNLELMVREAREAGAAPVVFSPIVRRSFNERGVLTDTHGAYPLVARQVAAELGVPFVDLQLLTEDLLVRAGPEESKRLFVWLAPGEHPSFPEGRQDDTHLSVRGGEAVARLAVAELERLGLPLARHVKNRVQGLSRVRRDASRVRRALEAELGAGAGPQPRPEP